MSTFLKDFKAFAMKGNVIDMAVGVVIGGAFGKIIASLVGDIIMPLVGVLVGGTQFTDLKWIIEAGETAADGSIIGAVTLNYGAFIQTTVDFLIIAFSIFLVIKAIGSLKRKEAAAPAPAPAPSKEELLLTEIRDLLKQK